MSRRRTARVVADIQLPHTKKARANAMQAIQAAVTNAGCRLAVRSPLPLLTMQEHRALALEVCRPFGQAKTWRGGGA